MGDAPREGSDERAVALTRKPKSETKLEIRVIEGSGSSRYEIDPLVESILEIKDEKWVICVPEETEKMAWGMDEGDSCSRKSVERTG